MFSNCSSLNSIDLSYFFLNESNYMYKLFFNCQKLELIKMKGNIDYMEYKEYKIPICLFVVGYHCPEPYTEVKNNNIFDDITSLLKKLDFFDMNFNFTYEQLYNYEFLEECLFYEYNSNIKKCKKYIGFHYCGKCINQNIEYYCTKKIENQNLNFYYLENQLNISVNERECYWSENFNEIGNYIFENNGEGEINYYKKMIEGYCEVFSEDKNGCIKCNNSKGFYKIENQEYKCSNTPPAENYILDKESKEWRLCNKRCQKCYIQSRSEIDHQCLICSQNYYPYKIDIENFINNKITGFNCFNLSEVKLEHLNYFLNLDNQFEKCDTSCQECESKYLCLKCNDYYYYIYGHENGTCFKDPLPYYGLIYINNNLFFKHCFNLCKYCYKITKSFLFQQCSQCDEIDYTLDIYSLNKS